jgi:shikimate dehydrogenase
MSAKGLQFGLTGWPLGHSLSPQIHAAALNALGLSGSYRLLPAPPLPEGAAELQATLSQVRRGQLQGLNVTIPHKQAVIPWLDELSAAAQAIGAVNVIYQRGDRLTGDNSDAPAFLADLGRFLSASPDYHEKGEHRQAFVIGAGGSARAVVYALLQDGWRVSLAARRVQAARELAGNLSLSCPQALPI